MEQNQIQNCPIDISLKVLGKKWNIPIIRDLLQGKKRFTDFLESNSGISTKVLSQRLVELDQMGFIDKIIVSKSPLRAEYRLTQKGIDSKNILKELAIFGIKYYSSEVFKNFLVDLENLDVLVTNYLEN